MKETRPPRQPKKDTRVEILTKARQMYLDGRLIAGDERLAHVLIELGLTTGAGYQIWDNQAAFRRDLMIYIAENLAYYNLSPASRAGLSWSETILRDAEQFYTSVIRGEFYLALRFLSLNDRPEAVTQAVQFAYERVIYQADHYVADLIEEHDRDLADGHTTESIASATIATLEGYALQERMFGAYDKVIHDGRPMPAPVVAVFDIFNASTVEANG